ncbi:MAG: flagellar protein FlaG [Lachnospiraceae bacterium]|nr:flagellar protein FlaG [Lachnospiraceae bacterium]
MALEPISSMMTMQAQQTMVKPAPVQTEKVDAGASETTQAAENLDNSIKVVENSKNKGEAQNGSEEQKSSQNEIEQIRKAVEKMKRNMPHSEAVFGIHEGTNRVTIKLVDKDTKEVIKELPPEKTLDMIAKVWEMAGILVDEKR